MTTLYREQLAILRAQGFDIFVIPGSESASPEGLAFRSAADEFCYINIFGPTDSPIWLFVLAHEVAHHLMGHTFRNPSIPVWDTELKADRAALRFINEIQPEAVEACEAAMRKHIRAHIQPMIDFEIWHHVDLETARWAGCDLPPDAEDACAFQTRAGAADDPEILF